MNKTTRRYSATLGLALLLLTACSRNTNDNSGEFTPYNTIPMTAEAEWARRITSLRVDDGGTNNGRTRIAILEVLLGVRERLQTQGLTPELREDINVVENAVERMYSSANTNARGEWQVISRYFVTLRNQLNSPDEAITTLNRIIAQLDG